MAILAALARDLLQILGVAILAASWALAGFACLPARIRRAEPLLLWSTAFALGASGSAVAVTLLAISHLLRRGTVVAVAASGVVVALIGARRLIASGALPSLPRLGGDRRRLAGLAALVAVGALSLFATLAPPTSMDAGVYHLRLPQQFLQAGGWVAPETFVSSFPLYVEMLFGEGLVLGGGTFAALIHWSLGIAALAAAGAWARRLGGSGLWAAVALGASALFVWEATSAFVDLGAALFASLALLWALEADSGASAVVLAGLFAGLAAGSKLTGAAMAAMAGMAAALTVWPDRGRGVRRLLAIGGLSLVVALPWYVRNALATGNPFFPVGSQFLGHRPPPTAALSTAMEYGYGRDLLHLLSSPFDLLARGDPFDQGWSLGPAYLALAPLGFVSAWRLAGAGAMGRRRAVIALGALTGWWVLWFLVSPQTRLLLPALPIAAGLAGAGATAAFRAASRPLRLLAMAVLGVTIAGGLGTALLTAKLTARVVLGLEPASTFLERNSWNYVAYQQANRLLPAGARLAVEGGPNLYYLEVPAVWLQVSSPASVAFLRERGFSHHLLIHECPLAPPLSGEVTLWEGSYPLRLSRLRGGVRLNLCARLTSLPHG
jgi:hypothetical protein